MRGIFLRLRSSLRRSRGVAAIEFAILAPFVICLLGGAMDLGMAFERSIRLENAARAGAQLALRVPQDTAAILAATRAAAGPGAEATVTALPCQCPAADGTNGVQVACTGTCATGMARYLRIQVTRPFAPIFPTSAIIPFNAIGATNADVVARIS